VPLTNERKREKSAPHLRLETRAQSLAEMCFGIRNEAAAIEKAAARDMLGERGSGSKWDMRGPRQRGSDTRQTSVICIPIISALFTATGGVIRFLVTINMRGRFQKSLCPFYIFGLEIYGMLLYWLAAMLSE
jgi:hypothetical protein